MAFFVSIKLPDTLRYLLRLSINKALVVLLMDSRTDNRLVKIVETLTIFIFGREDDRRKLKATYDIENTNVMFINNQLLLSV